MSLSRKHLIVIGGVVVVLGLLFALRRSKPLMPAEQAANELVDAIVTGVEAGDVDAVMDRVADDFTGELQGSALSRGELQRYLTMLTMRGGVGVTILTQEVTVDSETAATVIVRAVLTRGGLAGAAEGQVGAREFTADLEPRDGDWKVVSSSEQRVID